MDSGYRYPRKQISPEDLQDLAEEWREKLVETVAETDEALMERYLEGGRNLQKLN